MTRRLKRIARIVREIVDNDVAGWELRYHMLSCNWAWCDAEADHPDLTAEEIASAAACGFEVRFLYEAPTTQQAPWRDNDG